MVTILGVWLAEDIGDCFNNTLTLYTEKNDLYIRSAGMYYSALQYLDHTLPNLLEIYD